MRSTSSRKFGSRRLRGCGSVTSISLRMRPGLLPNTRMRSHISTASSMLCVTRITPLIGMLAFGPEVEEVGAQRLGGQHVERRERLVHQQDVRMHHQRAREADALAHAAGELARIGRLEAVQADQVDGRQRALADLRLRHVLRLETRARRSRIPSATETARSSGTPSRCPEARAVRSARRESVSVPALGLGQARDQPQQRRLARARAAEQADDLPRHRASG